jgi:hypothetical protein
MAPDRSSLPGVKGSESGLANAALRSVLASVNTETSSPPII